MRHIQGSIRHQQGWVAWLILGIVIVVAGAIAVAVGVSSTPSGSDPSGICYTSCSLVVELECGTGKLIGACFGWWECPAALTSPGSAGSSAALDVGVGAHVCLD